MAVFGADFRAGLGRALYRPTNPAGLGWAIAIFLGLVIVNQALQAAFGFELLSAFGATMGDRDAVLRAFMVGLLPASAATVVFAWLIAHVGRATAGEVLALRFVRLGAGGWAVIIGGFLAALYLLVAIVTHVLGIDTSQSQGLVEKTLASLTKDKLYPVIAAGIAIGAPLSEELTFRGQIFAALSQTRLGYPGTALVTSLVWSLIHITEPWYAVGLIFIMGLILSFLLVRFGSLWVTFVCHAVWNGIYAVALLALPQS